MPSAESPRLLVLTDIGGAPDDRVSVVRLMRYSNQIDIMGLVATPRDVAAVGLGFG